MEKQKYHFVGICGISMSALAIWLKRRGHYVQGSDININSITKTLLKNDIKVFNSHHKNNINGCDIIVYNGATTDNIEVKEAQKRGFLVISRAILLEMISAHYKKVIAVSGAHGKTTTTAMIYSCLKYANKKPTLHLGGVLCDKDSGLVEGNNEFFVTEACEYKNSFLHLKPTIGIVLNIEKEHLDFFKNFKNVKKSFQQFQDNSSIVVCNNKNVLKKDNVITFAGNGDFVAKNVKFVKDGTYSFDCYKQNKFYYHFDLGVVGKHNVTNALSVIATCDALNIEKYNIYKGLKNFIGIKRRFEKLGNNKIFLVHDYAHHPTEIKKTIEVSKKILKKQKLLVVFQPHTYSRTKSLLKEFKEVFSNLEDVMIIKTYSAREKYDKSSSAKALYNHIKPNNKHAVYFADFELAKNYIIKKIDKKYGVLILGAGDIDALAYNIESEIKKSST